MTKAGDHRGGVGQSESAFHQMDVDGFFPVRHRINRMWPLDAMPGLDLSTPKHSDY